MICSGNKTNNFCHCISGYNHFLPEQIVSFPNNNCFIAESTEQFTKGIISL